MNCILHFNGAFSPKTPKTQLMQASKVPPSMWSKTGRLSRSVMPKLTRLSTVFGSGATPGILSCIAGRLLCDTYLCARDLLKEVQHLLGNYTGQGLIFISQFMILLP